MSGLGTCAGEHSLARRWMACVGFPRRPCPRASIGYARCSYAQRPLCSRPSCERGNHGDVSSSNSMRFVRSLVLPQSGNHMKVLYRVGKQELSRPSVISR